MPQKFESFFNTVEGGNEGDRCHYPVRLDTYGCGCQHNCGYCYARSLLAFRGLWNPQLPATADINKIAKIINTKLKPGQVVRLGGMTDCFQPIEKGRKLTYRAIQMLNARRVHYLIVTKSALVASEPYLDVMDPALAHIQVSITTSDDNLSRSLERGVPSPQERLEAIGRIAEADAGGATLRLRPFIIGISTPSYLDLIHEAGIRGAGALSTEFMCVEMRSPVLRDNMPIFNRLCGFDFMEFYKRYSYSQGYLRLNRKVKEPFIRKMKEACDQLGMRFYVSDAHFKELCCNGSCCGLPPDWNYSRGQFCEALQIAKRNGVVRWSDISADVEALHQYQWDRTVGFNKNNSEKKAHFLGMTMADYMRWLWNNPQSGQNLYKMFEGIVVPAGKDEDGNIIYKYNGK